MNEPKALLAYLYDVDALRQPMSDRGWAFASHEGLTLAHGRWFELAAPPKRQGVPRACFYNAWNACQHRRQHDWTYCEGWAAYDGFVTAHAWVMQRDGTALEVTTGSGLAVLGYFGVPFTREYCLKRHRLHPGTERYSLFQNDYRTRYQMLREGLPSHAVQVLEGDQTRGNLNTVDRQLIKG